MMAAAEVSVEGAESVAEHLQPPAEEQEQAEEGQENSAAPQFASNIASKPRGASSPLYGEASGGGDVFVAATDAELSVVDQSASTCAPDAAHSMSTAGVLLGFRSCMLRSSGVVAASYAATRAARRPTLCPSL
eukprot:TRINITY_DN20685_c0_g1_i1.p1 TRINITY_DN20685_c0_g1~~TRINITY_DN20685_c0_g1_i1.p1  ORF type:complete len:133 (-),score=27.15 TRINITY_DN20685_c0_g1_i1:684-1082(-)